MSNERFKMVGAVHLFLKKDNQILLLRRFNTGYEDGNYSVIAGHLDGNEEVKKAAAREAKEEAGIILDLDDIEVVGLMHRKTTDERMDFFLVAEKWQGEIINMEPNKCDLLTWFELEDLPPNIIPYVEKAIKNYTNAIWFDSYGW
ncbi:NUDIX hydrolase [Bacillus sp. SCS-151]|uniref:NUDIX hydrolase n=1 Tax=Nanhaiella sioensis TaxID=3115293 RepID=UPI00397A9719